MAPPWRPPGYPGPQPVYDAEKETGEIDFSYLPADYDGPPLAIAEAVEARDINWLYNQLIALEANPGVQYLADLIDVVDSPALANQVLVWNGAQWAPVDPLTWTSAIPHTTRDLDDVAKVSPAANQVFVFQGGVWTPVNALWLPLTGGTVSGALFVTGQSSLAKSVVTQSDTGAFTVRTSPADITLVVNTAARQLQLRNSAKLLLFSDNAATVPTGSLDAATGALSLPGTAALDHLTKVSLTSPGTGWVLTWNGSEYVPQAVPVLDVDLSTHLLREFMDVADTAASNNQVLTYVSGLWGPVSPSWLPLTGGVVTGTEQIRTNAFPAFRVANASNGEVLVVQTGASGSQAVWTTGDFYGYDKNGNPVLNIQGNAATPSVELLRLSKISATAPTANWVVTWNGTEYVPAAPASNPLITDAVNTTRDNRRYSYLSAQPGQNTSAGTGPVGNPGGSGTAATADDVDGPWLGHTQATVNLNAGKSALASVAGWWPDWGLTYIAKFKTDAVITTSRFWLGWCSGGGPMTVDAPTTLHVAAVRWSTTVPDTAFQCITSNNSGTLTITPAGVNLVANTVYTVKIVLTLTTVTFFINGVQVAQHTTRLPAAGTLLGWFTMLNNTAGGANRVFKFGSTTIISEK